MAGKKKKARNHKNTMYTAIVFFLLLEFFVLAWCRIQCRQTGYAISRAVTRTDSLTRQQEKLQVELARMQSPDRIMRIAKERLGLVMPGPEQVVVVK